jgi:hypothetical protein
MKILRLLLVAAAVAGAGFLAFRGFKGTSAPPQETPGPAIGPGQQSPVSPWTPMQGTTSPSRADGDPPRRVEVPPEPDVDKTLGGDPVKADDAVSVVVPYATGTKTRYRVAMAEMTRDRAAANGATSWFRWIWAITTEVVQADGTGAARIKFTLDDFEFQTTAPTPIQFVSSAPNKRLLDQSQLGRTLKPWMAVRGMPVEFVLDAGGAIRSIEGIEPMRRKYLDVLDVMGATVARDAPDAPSAADWTERWSELLFPPLGGGTLKGSETREVAFTTTYFDRWAAITKARARVTHADADTFRVEAKGTPHEEELQRPVVNASAQGIAKIHVNSDADAYVASWRFDRAKGRLLASRLHEKFTLWVSQFAGSTPQGQPNYAPKFFDIERLLTVETLGD